MDRLQEKCSKCGEVRVGRRGVLDNWVCDVCFPKYRHTTLEGVEFICPHCAVTLRGEWPEGHMATQHEDECGVCGTVGFLANTGDWNWPDGIARGMRD